MTPEEFDTYLFEGRQIRTQMKALEERRRELDQTIMAELLGRGELHLKQHEGSWSIQTRTTSTLSLIHI